MKIESNIQPRFLFKFEIEQNGVFEIRLSNFEPNSFGDAIIVEENGNQEVHFQELQKGAHLVRLKQGATVRVLIFQNENEPKVECQIDKAKLAPRICNFINLRLGKLNKSKFDFEAFRTLEEVVNINNSKISIIIPTHNNYKYIAPLWLNTLSKLHAEGVEVVLINHNGSDTDCLEIYEEIRRKGAKVIDINCDFNFAYLMNQGALVATGDILVFMNDDIIANNPDDLRDFANMHLQTGAVLSGALLTYRDGRIQHIGVKYGENGFLDHVARFKFPQELGNLPQFISADAVTGALMAIKRPDFLSLTGFDETLIIECNDIDLCERAKAIGGAIAVNCQKIFTHDESASRNKSDKRDLFHNQKINDRLSFFAKYWRKIARI